MDRKTIVLVHGFASSGQSRKATFFRTQFSALPQVEFHAIDMNPTPRDFEYMTVTGQINRLRQCILDYGLQPLGLIGSSLGGLVCLHYADRFAGVERMLLLAPVLALHPDRASEEELGRWKEAGAAPVFHYGFEREVPLRYDFQVDGQQYRGFVAPAAPTLIVHGRSDEAVPIEHSRAYARAFAGRTRLIEVDGGHDLNQHMPFIWEHAEAFLLQV